MNSVTLTAPLQLSAEWSGLLVGGLFPLAPMALAAAWLVSAARFERWRRAVVSPAAGYRAVEGTIARGRNPKLPAVQATFELETKKLKGGTGFRLRSHGLTVHPFTLSTDTGEIFEVRPDRDAVALHAPVEGEHTTRHSSVGAGDRVWIYGPTDVVREKLRAGDVAPSSNATPTVASQSSGASRPTLWVSTVSIAEVLRSERNRRLGLAAALVVFLVAAELVVFGGYWDVVRAGRPVVGHVVDKAMRFDHERSRFGRSLLTTGLAVTVEAEGRRQEFDVVKQSWDVVDLGTPVALLASPSTLVLGPKPHTTIVRCVVMAALVFSGLLGFGAEGMFQRPWYTVKRGWRGTDRAPHASEKTAS